MIIGIDLGGMSAKGAVLSDGKLLGKGRVVTDASKSPEHTVSDLAVLCRETAERAGVPFEKIEAIGIGAPGVINGAEGSIVWWSNFGWKNVPLARMLAEKTGKKVFLANDANAAALGEAKYGAGKRYSHSTMITLGTGVGGGIIIDGKLFEGYEGAGAELGHMTIQKEGVLCTCGRRGCFEAYASATALVRDTRAEMERDLTSKMWELAQGDLQKADGKTAFDGMRAGDESAKKVVNGYIASLGDGIVNIGNVLRPQAIILGGGVSAEGDYLLTPLKEYVYPRLYVSNDYVKMEIICAELGNDAGLYGAAQYAIDNL